MVKVALLVVMCIAVMLTPHAEADISCKEVLSSLGPCIPYLRSAGGVSAACCNGIRSLNRKANTTPDRQTACKCIKSAIAPIRGINFGVVPALPGKCGVILPYTISPSIDCSKVK